MPILTASGRMSVKTAVQLLRAGIRGWTPGLPWTPVVFWAVRAVMAVMA